jgi:hypothetical protein
MVDKRKFQDRTIRTDARESQAGEHEVPQRATAKEPVGTHDAQAAKTPADEVGEKKQTVGASHEERENPAAGTTSGQSGTRQAHERPGVGNMRASNPGRASDADRKAMSQNGARISDFGG